MLLVLSLLAVVLRHDLGGFVHMVVRLVYVDIHQAVRLKAWLFLSSQHSGCLQELHVAQPSRVLCCSNACVLSSWSLPSCGV